jgi:hypothetical protein
MLIPPPIPAPDTLKGVDDLIRSGFEQFSELWFRRLLEATALVAIGLLFELPEIWHEFVEAIKELFDCGPEKRIKPWAKLFGTVGWILIVVGVCGEFWAESVTSRADGFIRKFDEILLAEANRNAGAAADSAKTAHDEADETHDIAGNAQVQSKTAKDASDTAQRKAAEVERQADIISNNLLRASQQVDAIERQVFIQGPRWVALGRSKDRFIESLKPFAGTRVTLVNCGQHPPFEQEKLLSDLRRLLISEDGGAGWLVSISAWDSCEKLGFAGNLLVSRRANDAAFSALFHALLNAGISSWPFNEMPENIVATLGEDSPWALVAKDPASIFLVVGINPMIDVEKLTRTSPKNLANPPK